MAQAVWLGQKVGGHMALFLHSSREPGELLQCSKHDALSTINIILVIIIIIITTNTSSKTSTKQLTYRLRNGVSLIFGQIGIHYLV